MSEIIFLNPIFKQMIWGGNKLKTEFGYDIPGDDTGECWAVSAHEHGDCEVASGTYAGKKLSWLWENKRELFGNYPSDKFPLLVKIIDAKNDLSIQVHPDDIYAAAHENGTLGKMECWYILDTKADNDIIIGHNAKTKKELVDMINNKQWDKLIRKIPVHKGDFLQINPGTMHAIKGGTLLLETQQNSDTTYRIYDYDRLSNGKPRELHIDKSIDVINVPYVEDSNKIEKTEKGFDEHCNKLISCERYTVIKIDVDGKAVCNPEIPFFIMSVTEGNGTINGISIKKGMHFILPNKYGEFVLEGKIQLICSYPAK